MSTYSIGNPPVDALKLSDLQSILNILPDNTSKLIAPKNIRNAVYTLYENIAFKPTNIPSSLIQYIGIDNSILTQKYFFGNRQVDGQYVMSDDLLSSDVDIFFYNTRINTGVYDTKLAFLAGTGSFYDGSTLNAPYLQAKSISATGGNYINLEVSNYIGDINLKSSYGDISINGIIMPNLSANSDSSKDGYVLKYRYNYGVPLAIWENSASQSSITSMISSTTVSISGSPVLLNGNNVNFTDIDPTPTTIGGIPAGTTFSNIPTTEMLRRLLYPYISPLLSTTLNQSYIEAGNTSSAASLVLTYTITRNATYSINGLSVTTGAYTGTLSTPGSIINGTTVSSIVPIPTTAIPATQSWLNNTWSLSLSDSYVTTKTSSVSIKTVIPWFYGTGTISCTSSAINTLLGSSVPVLGKLTSILTEPGTASITANKTVSLSTTGLLNNQGYIYFGYPADFPDLIQIKDQNNYDITNVFKKFIISGVSSPNIGWWSSKMYKFYIYTGSTYSYVPSLTTINYGSTYQFNFIST